MRLLTYNVHGFTNVNKKDTLIEIITNIKKIDADILILQEVTLSIFKTHIISKTDLTNKLKENGYNFIFFSNDVTNLIASKIDFKKAAEIHLGRDKRFNVARNALIADFNDFVIVGTHLDVFDNSGKLRINQMNMILNYLKENYNDKKTIIGGDLNSLRKADYTENEYKKIVEEDAKRKIRTIEDVIPLVESNNYVDSFVGSNDEPPKVTVWSNRRIDYIMGKNIKFIASHCLEDNSSDHYPVYADFQEKN